MVGGGDLRWWVAADGRRWPAKWPEKHHTYSSHETGHGLFKLCGGLLQWFWSLPKAGELLGVLGVHLVAVANRKMAKKLLENQAKSGAQQGRRIVQLIGRETLDTILKALLAQLK